MTKSTMDRKAAKLAMLEAAKDMGISASELAEMVEVEREIAKLETPIPARDNRDESDRRKVLKRADRVAESYGTFKPDHHKRESVREFREAVKRDQAVHASRKIIRAIPRNLDAVVTTRVGLGVVEINRVFRADNPEAIARKLSSATAREASALEARATAEAEAEAKTVMGRTPKAEADAVEAAKVRADRQVARVAKLRKQLAQATGMRVADGMTYSPVGEVLVSLRPQSMANRVAVLSTRLSIRQDVHPFRYELRERHIPRVPYGKPYGGEAAYLLYESMMEAEAKREAAREAAKEKADAAYGAHVAKLEAEAEAKREVTRSEYKAREAMRKREARRRAKSHK